MDKTFHILIVDDNPLNLELLTDILRKEKYNIVISLDGQEAIDTARQIPFDLVLLDVNMPDIDGYEVCRQFKLDDTLCDIPILFISAASGMKDKLRGFEVGGVDYVTKPFDPSEIIARVKVHLVLQNVQTQLQEQNTQLQNEINRRQQVEAELRESEEKYRSLFEKTNDAVFIVGLDFKYIDVNQQAADLLGYSTEEIIGRDFKEFLMPDEFIIAMNRSAQLFSGEVFPAYERIFKRKDGQELLAEINATLIRDDNDQPLYIHSTAHDISERKQLEDALKDSEQRYRQILENAGEAMFTTDLLGFFTFANPIMTHQTGYSVDELVGMHFTEVIDETWREQVLNFYQKQFVDHIHETVLTFPLYNFQDKQIWVEQTTNLIMNGEEIVGFLGISRDVTERKKVEEERERLIAELDAFAHTVAHDLKTPLSTIDINTYMLETRFEKMTEEKRKNSLQRLRTNVYKMTNIIDALLLLASVRKLENITTHQLDMEAIVEEALHRLSTQVEQNNAEIIISDTFPSVIGYAPWVEEVWVNYLSNALKYGGNPPIVIVGADIISDDLVRFWVKDNGAGLSEDDQMKLFIPFTRLNQVDVKGHGLGLSIVQRIVEKLSGTTGISSKIGKGSTFYFTLPNG